MKIISKVTKEAYLVKDESLKCIDAPFYQWIRAIGFEHAWYKGHYDVCDWAFISIEHKLYAYGMPGIEIVKPIGGHSITIDEFLDKCSSELTKQDWRFAIIIATEYLRGEFCTRNVPKAIQLYEEAFDQGRDMGNECLGELYYKGEYVEQDYKKAYEYFTSYNEPCSFIKPYCLGVMYMNGLYVEKDISKAKRQFLKITEREEEYCKEDVHYDPAVEKLREIEEMEQEIDKLIAPLIDKWKKEFAAEKAEWDKNPGWSAKLVETHFKINDIERKIKAKDLGYDKDSYDEGFMESKQKRIEEDLENIGAIITFSGGFID